MPPSLSPQQQRAVTAPIGPVLVLAGPGAGKTRCLHLRIEHLIRCYAAEPARICAVTFTNKAAQEIRDRLRASLGETAAALTLGTIHALCQEILKPNAELAGLPPGYGIADEKHQAMILARLGVRPQRHSQLLILFGRSRLEGRPLTEGDSALLARYTETLRRERLIDYDEILQLTRDLLSRNPALLERCQARWDHLLVDEVQDLDPAQYTILRLLAERHRSLFAVGDDDQSIFSWRGADPRIILRLSRDFAIDDPIVLDLNWRCSTEIFDTARRILPPGELLFSKQIRAVKPSRYPIRVLSFRNETEETRWIVADILEDLAASGLPRGRYGVLYRRHLTGETLEDAFLTAGIPCQTSRGRALIDDPVVDQLATSLRIAIGSATGLEIERLARDVLDESVVAAILATPAPSFLARLRHYASLPGNPNARPCWRLLYHIDNLRGLVAIHTAPPGRLPATAHTLESLLDAILALGVGEYRSVLDRHAAALSDPEECEPARALARRLLNAATLCLPRSGGVEVPAAVMLRKTLPALPVEYAPAAPDTPLPDILTLFKALQLATSRRHRPFLTEFVAFDTETTGNDPATCEVVELAAVRVRDGRIVGRFQQLVKPACPVSPGAARIHGYTDAALASQPPFDQVWPRFRAFAGPSVLVAHNGFRFDLPVLKRLSAPLGGMDDMPVFDTLPLARSLFNSGNSLSALAARFGIDPGRGHHALDDSICLAQVFIRLQDEHLRRARVTSLAHLLDCLAAGLALEARPDLSPEAQILFEAGRRQAFRHHSTILETYRQEHAPGSITPEELERRLGGSEFRDQVRKQRAPDERFPELYQRLRTLAEACHAPQLPDAARLFLDRLALSRSDGAETDPHRVALLTFHATKGLEFSRVYLVGIEDNEVPGYYPLADQIDAEIREARRLVYTAMTRAEDRLTITRCRTRNGRNSGGSRFLDEMGLSPIQTNECT